MPDDVTAAFLNGSLSPTGFDHRAHVHVARTLLSGHSFLEAAALYDRGLEQITTKAGVPAKRSVTKTIAFLALIAESDIQPGPGALSRWYSKQRLDCEMASDQFVMPDQYIE
jgi:hypothetical protein